MTARATITAAAPIYVSINDAKAHFSLSRDTFYRAANRGEIRIYKRGSRSLLKVAEVMAWVEGREPTDTDNGGRLVGKSGAKT